VTLPGSAERRFWSKIDQDGPIPAHAPHLGRCRVRTDAPKRRGGYGRPHVDGRALAAHRISWLLHHGPIPEGPGVLHRCCDNPARCDPACCDNPARCDPAHLFLGTNADDTRDAQVKGRLASGTRHVWRRQPERHPVHVRPELKKLKEEEVRAMRGLRRQGMTYVKIAERFAANARTVQAAVRGISWR
jgi:hypothetical protein